MRYSRFRRRSTQRRYTSVIILGLLLFLGFYIASAGAAGNFISRIISPIINAFDNDAKQDGNDDVSTPPDTDLTLPGGESSKETERVTEQIDIAPMSFHAIQLGALPMKMPGQPPLNCRTKAVQGLFRMISTFAFWLWGLFQRMMLKRSDSS